MGRHSTDYDPVQVLGYGPGDLIVYTGKNGHDHDKVHADKYLFAGNKYRVAWVDVGGWHSDVWIEGFSDDVYFNSVHFEKYDESKQELLHTDSKLLFDSLHSALNAACQRLEGIEKMDLSKESGVRMKMACFEAYQDLYRAIKVLEEFRGQQTGERE